MSLAFSVSQPSLVRTEHDLVAAVRAGSDRAFEELYSRYRSRIFSYIFGMLGDHGRAEDIAQEVFISALRRLRDTERPIAFKPWLYEIAKNACIDEFRRGRKQREVPLESGAGDGEIQSRGPTPDAAVQNKQSLADLRGAFHGLSENHHKIIVMRELEGLSYSQIGERLGLSRPIVESTLFRARRRLGEEYDELISGRRCEHVQTLIAGEERRSLLKLGVRERRQLARHLAHCQPCRREARMAGVDESFFKVPQTLAGKIAALLPIPWLRGWRSDGGRRDGTTTSTSHPFAAMRSLQTLTRLTDPANPAVGFGRAAATFAAIAAAGIGGGVMTGAIGAHARRSVPSPTRVRAVPRPSHHSASRAGARASVRRAAPGEKAAGRSGRGRSGSSTSGTGVGGPRASSGRTAASTTAGSSSPGTAGSSSSGSSTTAATTGITSSSGALPGSTTLGSVGVTVPNLQQPLPQPTALPPLPKLSTPQLPTLSVPTAPLPDPRKALGGLSQP